MKFSAVTVIFSKWTLCAAALSGTVAIYGDTCQELFKNGEILRGRRKYAEAQECFRKAAEITEPPADRQALVRLRIGQCYFWMKKYDPAIAEMKKAAAIPGITGYYRSDINAWIGNTYKDMKKYDAAAAAYEQAARLAPASLPQMSFNALMNAASCRKIQGRWSEAAVLIKQASDLRKLPADPAIWGTRNYVVTGWLNKKWVHPNYQYTGISWNSNYSSCRVPIPIVRLAEMYLSLAECEAQCGNTTEALKYLNKVRERAGVTPWTTALLTAKNKTALQAVLDERFVECYLEGYRYYDIRRYLQGRERLAAGNWQGLNAIQTAPSFSTFNTVVNINQPFEWNDRMYLLPVSNNEVYSNPNMVQAPGY